MSTQLLHSMNHPESSMVVYFMERGVRKAKQEDILQALTARFAMVPPDLTLAIGRLQDLQVPDGLHLAAVWRESLEVFQRALHDMREGSDF